MFLAHTPATLGAKSWPILLLVEGADGPVGGAHRAAEYVRDGHHLLRRRVAGEGYVRGGAAEHKLAAGSVKRCLVRRRRLGLGLTRSMFRYRGLAAVWARPPRPGRRARPWRTPAAAG